MISATDHGDEDLVTVAHVTEISASSSLAAGSIEFKRTFADDIGGNNLVDQIVDTGAAKFGQHLFDIGIRRSNMSSDKVTMHLKFGQCCAALGHR